MNCAGCDKILEKREHAQAMAIGGHRYRPKSACDTCCRANLWTPGTLAALDRLATGELDQAEVARIAAATADWLKTLHAA